MTANEAFEQHPDLPLLLEACSRTGGVKRDTLSTNIIAPVIIEKSVELGYVQDKDGILSLTKTGKALNNVFLIEKKKEKHDRIMLGSDGKLSIRMVTERILEEFKHYIFFEKKTKTLFVYDNKRGLWRDGTIDIEKKIRAEIIAPNLICSNIVDEVLNDIKGLTAQPERPPEPHWRYVNLANGVFDVLEPEPSKRLGPHTHKHFFVNQVPIALDNKIITCPIIDALLLDWMDGNKDKAYTLKEISGYTLLRTYSYQKIFFAIGAGNNGKRVYGEINRRLLGNNNVIGIGLDDIATSHFTGNQLMGRLLNICSEMNIDKLSKTDMLKKLTGQDWLSFDKKYSPEYINYLNYCKILVFTNSIPPTPDKTQGWYRRYYPTYWNQQYYGEKERKHIAENLPETELQGYLWQLLNEVIPAYIKRGEKFQTDPTVEELEEAYENQSNPLHSFLSECFERVDDPQYYIPTWVFREIYQDYATTRGKLKFDEEALGRIMKNREGFFPKLKQNLSPELKQAWHKVAYGDNYEQRNDIRRYESSSWRVYEGLQPNGNTLNKHDKQDKRVFYINSLRACENLVKVPVYPVIPVQSDRKRMILDYLRKNKGETLTTIQVNLNIDPEIVKKDVEQFLDDGLLYRDKEGNLFTKDSGAAL